MAWMQPLVRRRGCGGRSAVHLFRVALPRSRRVRPAEPRSVALGRACRDPAQIGPTHALNPTAGGGSAPRTPAPRLLCRAWPPCRQGGGGRPGPRLAARAILPALGLACPLVPALCWSPCGCGRAVGRVAPVLGGSSGLLGWGVLWLVPSLSFRPALSSCRVGLFRSWRPGGVGWSGLPWPLARVGGGCGPRRGRSRRRWSWSGSRRSPPLPRSRRPGRAGSASRWPCGGSRVRCSGFPCRWPSRRLSGCRLLRRCPLRWSGRGRGRRSGFPLGSSRRRCRRRWPARFAGYSTSSPTGHSNRCRAAALAGMKSINSGSLSGAAGSASGHSFACQH